ncbi:hypothetical protein M404DRAFT_171840, partial [Pisolithus tinctorius Marx 270]
TCGDSAKMRRLLVQKLPHLIIVDCWAHQAGNILPSIVKWFNNHSHALGILLDTQHQLVGQPLSLVLPILTWWTSHFLSVHQLLQLEPAFKQMLTKVPHNDLIMCAGSRADMKRKAQQVLDILQHYDFWYKFQIVKQHLKPLAIATNATQSNYAWLEVVLVTLVILYHKFCDPTLDPTICEAAHNSLEKHWKKADQDIFLLTVILNPYLWVSCFSEHSPYWNFSNVWHLSHRVFQQLYGMEPNLEFQ